MKVSVEVINRQRKIRISLKKVISRIRKILRFLYETKNKKLIDVAGKNTVLVSVIFVGDRKMKELNFKYRGKNSTTDVLSFPYLVKEPSGSVFLGEIIIDLKKVFSQARQYNVTGWQELDRVLVHGILHLIGYDHEKTSQALKMRRIEKEILKHLQS